MQTRELVKILENISDLLELKGENPFKARAYQTAAQTIINEDIDIEQAVTDNTLKDIPGFGEALQKKVAEYVLTGKMTYYEELLQQIPPGLLEMVKLSGIGPKKVKRLYEELGISTVEELEKACHEDKIAHLKGFGAKTQETILNSIEHRKASRGRFHQQQALAEAQNIFNILDGSPGIKRVSLTGSIRRRCDTISEIYFLAAVEKPEDINTAIGWVLDMKFEDGLYKSNTTAGIPVIIEPVLPEDFAWRLHEGTGNTEYLESFNELLSKNDYAIDFDGIYMSDIKVELEEEADLYEILDIQYVLPELRESGEALTRAIEKTIPQLIEPGDLKGMLHVHSKWSDGKDTIRDMALKAKEMGFSYIAMCDHSQSAAYAGGLTPDRLKKQHEEIDNLNEEGLGIYILKGIESDILTDGSLDYPDNILASFDIVVASVHSSFKMAKEDMTRRVVNALKNPFTTILGHPTGRLLLARPAYEIDIKEVIDTAAGQGKVIEINANPYRLDLSWENAKYGKEQGLKIAINPDSHQTETLSDIYTGVNVARKAWLEPSDVINCLEYEEFVKRYCKKQLR